VFSLFIKLCLNYADYERIRIMPRDHATSEELERAHNEGQAWGVADKDLGLVGGFLHEFDRYATDLSGSFEGRNDEIKEAFEKGVDNVRKQ